MCRSGKHSLQDAKCIMDEMWEEYIRSKQDSKDTERLVNRAILEHRGTPTWLRFLVFSFGFHAEHSCHRQESIATTPRHEAHGEVSTLDDSR